MGGTMKKTGVISKWFTWYGWKYPKFKADSLHFNIIAIVLFQMQSAVVQSQNMCYRPNTFGAHCIHHPSMAMNHSPNAILHLPLCLPTHFMLFLSE